MKCPVIVVCVFIMGMFMGIVLHKIIPRVCRRLIEASRTPIDPLLGKYGKWSIAIYEGDMPFGLKPAEGIPNPVITPERVTDTDAIFVADPFIFRHEGEWHMFFEVMPRDTERGIIGRAESADGREWHYRGIVLREDFHMSYPQVFRWEGGIYMIPESAYDYSVRLYRAAPFPGKWDCVGKLLTGHDFTDATVFRHDGGWWMFVSNTRNDALSLYFLRSSGLRLAAASNEPGGQE